jgi:hypothetical protein
MSVRPLASAVWKDEEERERKRQEYTGLMDMRDEGILNDLRRLHNLHNPTRDLLLVIAMIMARETGVTLPREEKRRRGFLIGWLNLHYDKFKDHIPNLVLIDKKGPISGPKVSAWCAYESAHPDAPAVRARIEPRVPTE